ncbi:Gaa1-like protein [Polychytrium aggregatum]|uniref:Gaa1-like protein n=1 Tax=Polychytrium aggregatum TaxID=110093 RepID=UPI0022FDC252|nr:Gaa1-like protein [Polychytrium aggregatum]KAI9208976.1 Gaa1-like protein [Polychytrium aggregatum]
MAAGNTTKAVPSLLSRTHRRRVIGAKFQSLSSRYGWALYWLGLAALLALPFTELHKEAFIDENALLPGQTSKLSEWSHIVHQNTKKTQIDSFARLYPQSSLERALFLKEELESLGLDADTQRFEVFGLANQTIASGVNAFGIVRAPRADGSESILLSAPWIDRHGQYNQNGIATLLAFAKLAREGSYWAKDLILLFPDSHLFGTDAWLRAYHGIDIVQADPVRRYESLRMRGGAIQQAINIEFDGLDDYDSIGLLPDGVNGQLCNLDVVFTTGVVAGVDQISVHLYDGETARGYQNTATDRYLFYLKAILLYMKRQAFGYPSAEHALYTTYKIEAITIAGLRTGHAATVSPLKVLGLIEQTARSFNNLLEQLHHSYWFYIMPDATHFIPLPIYIGPIILLSSPLVLHALSMWWRSGGYNPAQSPPSEPSVVGPFCIRPRGLSLSSSANRHLREPVAVLVVCYLAGALCYFLSNQLQDAGEYLATYAAPAAIMIVASAAVRLSLTVDYYVLSSLASLLLSISLLTIATLNPSLSIALALFAVPVFGLVQPVSPKASLVQWLGSALKWVLLVVVSPSGLALVATALVGRHGAETETRRLVESSLFFGSWVWGFLYCCYLPPLIAGMVAVLGVQE